MNRRRIDKLIPAAMEVVADEKEIFQAGKIQSKYISYINAFGPTVVQTSLLQAFMVYYRESDKANRGKIMDMLEKLLINELSPNPANKEKRLALETKSRKGAAFTRWRNLVLEAVVALKLAMRTWPKDEEKKKQED